jgi:hypothetical protein
MFKRKLDSEPVAANLKKYDLVVDYCACTLAICIIRHLVDANNVHIQWSAGQLKESLNGTALGRDPNFYIDALALSHGLLMFRKDITRRGITAIEMFRDDQCVPPYHQMKASRMSIEVKFTGYHTPHALEADLLSYIVLLRNDILKRNKYESSPYSFPSVVFGVMQINLMQNRATREIGTNTPATSANFRKSPSNLTDRSIKNVTAKVITSVERVVGEEHSLHFLKSAVKLLDFKHRKDNNEEEEDEEINSEDIINGNEEDVMSPNDVEYEQYKNDVRLKTAIANVPGKNIIFSMVDINNVLKVFDVVRLMATEKNATNINTKSALITVDMMSEHAYYSQLTTRAVIRWHQARDKMNAKPGRKIDITFESEVWGKLMLCVFERSSTNVSLLINKYIDEYIDIFFTNIRSCELNVLTFVLTNALTSTR